VNFERTAANAKRGPKRKTKETEEGPKKGYLGGEVVLDARFQVQSKTRSRHQREEPARREEKDVRL